MKSFSLSFFFQHNRLSRITLFSVLSLLIFTGVSCFKEEEIPPPEPVTLTIWRTSDSQGDFDAMVEGYKKIYPYVNFEFRVLRPDEYEEALFNAWARGEGPDIFSVPQYRLGRFRDVIAPMPESVTLKTTRSEKGGFGGNKIVVEENSVAQLSSNQIADLFVGSVSEDVVFQDQIYGLPLSMDTLVLYYNRDILSRAKIAVPPTTWEEFVTVITTPDVVLLNEEKEIIQAGASLGTSTTTPYFFDILSVLMMQNGVTMTKENSPSFASSDFLQQSLAALSFYVSFSDETKATYTWNDENLDGLETFLQGKSAFYFGYYADKEKIEQRAAELNFSWTGLPQVNSANPVHYASYPIETVHIQSPDAQHAWNFLRFAATSEEPLASYLQSANRIPALRTVVAQNQSNPDTGVFMQQSLTAQSWYHGVDPDAAIDSFRILIDTVREKSVPQEDLLMSTESTIQLTMQKNE